MIYLLDVSALLALLWETHEFHERVTRWQEQQSLALCPLVELGFLRISTQPAFGLTPAEARHLLGEWKRVRQPVFVPCDLTPLAGDEPPSSGQTTDFYLASLALKNGMAWATLDGGVKHPASFLIPK
jgi:predicted nucleic acid-binding protein